MEKRFQQTEATLKSMEERYQFLGECAPLGIFTMDSQGKITGITRKTLMMFSRSTSSWIQLMDSAEFQVLLASDLSEDAGDEFVVVLPETDQAQAMEKALEIRSRVKDTVYELEPGIEIRMQASFGLATFPRHATDLNGLIAAADQALFGIKKNGRDAVGRFRKGA